MPSFQNIIDAAEMLHVRCIEVDQIRCVAVRNRNATCRKCVDACIASAISIHDNQVDINASACVDCGACIAVCPTDALTALEPTQTKVLSSLSATHTAAGGCAIIACARKASKHQADPEKFVEVPCLAHISEEELVSSAAAGMEDLVLVDGICETCRYGAVSPWIDAAVENAARMLEAVEGEAIITRCSEFPPEVLEPHKTNIRGESRRGILTQTGNYVKTVAGNVAHKTIEDRLGSASKAPIALKDRLGAGKSGKIPPFSPERNYRLLDALARVHARARVGWELDSAEARERILDTRHFGEVTIDASRCSGCGICVLFCPTEALRYADYDEPADEGFRYLEFHDADCTQCMMCKDVCLRDCIEVSPSVRLGDLFEFEPRLIEIPKPQDKTNILSRFHR